MIFELFKNKKIDEIVKVLPQYIDAQYAEEKPEKEDSGTAQYSNRPGQYSDRDVYYSDRDNGSQDPFVMEQVAKIMKAERFETARILKQLDDVTNPTFTDCVRSYIKESGQFDSVIYRRAQLDRRLFSKMMADKEYKPSKDTALALIFALELPLQEAKDLLSRAGYTLSHSSKRDIIIEYLILEKVHKLDDVNDVLYRLEQKTIGR